MSKNKPLILFTLFYPFGDYDHYLDNEVQVLASKFERVIIVPLNKLSEAGNYELPPNCQISPCYLAEARRSKGLLLTVILSFFNRHFYRELFNLTFIYKLFWRPAIIKQIFISFHIGNHYQSFLKKLAKNHSFALSNTVVYSYWMLDNLVSVISLKREFPGIKAISRVHGSDLYFERHKPEYLPLRRILFENLDSVFFISDNGRKYFIEKHKIADSGKLQVSYLGIKNKLKIPDAADRSVFNLTSVSWILPLKRVELIIDALKSIDNLQINWTHYGGVSNTSSLKEYSSNVLNYAKRSLEKKDNICFDFKGDVPNQEILKSYSNGESHCLINLSEFEGLPISIMEAISFGIPVIATNVGGVSEIVQDLENGLLLNSNPQAKEVTEAIMRMINFSNVDYEQMRTNALETWKQKFNAEVNYSEFAERVSLL